MRRIIEKASSNIRRAAPFNDTLKYKSIRYAEVIKSPNLGAVLLTNEGNQNRISTKLCDEIKHCLDVFFTLILNSKPEIDFMLSLSFLHPRL